MQHILGVFKKLTKFLQRLMTPITSTISATTSTISTTYTTHAILFETVSEWSVIYNLLTNRVQNKS